MLIKSLQQQMRSDVVVYFTILDNCMSFSALRSEFGAFF